MKIQWKKLDMKNQQKQIRASFTDKNFKRGSYRAGLTIVVLAVIIMLNLVLGQVFSSNSSIDLSDQSLYQISDTTKDILKGLSDDITITLVAQSDKIDPRIEKLIKQYTSASDHVKSENLDPVLHPAKAQELGVSDQTVLVTDQTTGKSKTINFTDIITYDASSYYNTGSYQETSFDGEGQLTSAIQGLTKSSDYVIYQTEGHGESSFASTITKNFDKANLKVSSCNLMMDGSIPDDCSLLIINCPTKDFDTTEIQTVEKFLDNGGNVMVLLGSGENSLTNLYAFTKDYGLIVNNGYIADMERCYQQNYYTIFPNINTSNEIASSMDSNSLVLVNNSLGMTQTDPKNDNITVTPLLTTSSNGYLVTSDTQTKGTYLLGATAVTYKEDEDGNQNAVSKLCVISAGSLIDSSIIDQFSSLYNSDLFMNTVNWYLNNKANTAIAAKSLQVQYNTVTRAGLISLIFIFLIPILFLVIGLTHWLRRRKQ